MPKNSVFDTRFFIEYFFTNEATTLKALKNEIQTASEKNVSAITFHELYKINIEKLGKETAKLRCMTIRDEFKIINIDYTLATEGAELSHRHKIPLADSIIAATAMKTGSIIISNDPHFKLVPEIKTKWPI